MTEIEYVEPDFFEDEASPLDQQEMAAARLSLQSINALNAAMRASGITRTELSERLGVGLSRVSQILNGQGNLRISTFARALEAIGYNAQLKILPSSSKVPALPPKPNKPSRVPATTVHVYELPLMTSEGGSPAVILTQAEISESDVILGSPVHIGAIGADGQRISRPAKSSQTTRWKVSIGPSSGNTLRLPASSEPERLTHA